MNQKIKRRLSLLFVPLVVIVMAIVATEDAKPHTQPCTIVYEGVPADPLCRMEMIPGRDGKVVEVYICQ